MSSVVPPPISSRQQPRSRSSCVRQDSAEASGSPTMPMGSRMPSCASTRNSCGSTCSTSRSGGSVMLRAASMARRTSSRSMSRGRLPRVTPPRLLTPRTWLPATPISADSTGTLATPSASSTARRMELTVESRLTISPLRKPFDSAAPSARNLTWSSSISAISAEVLVLPMSSSTRYLSFFAKRAPGPELSRFRDRCPGAGVRVQDHLPRILQVDRAHAAVAGLPLREIVHHHAVLAGEIACAELDADDLRIIRRRNSGHHDSQVLGIRQIDFADAVGRAGTHEIYIPQEFLVRLHPPPALVAWRAFGKTGDDWKLIIFAAWTVQNHAMGVDESKFRAIAEESDRRTFGQLNADVIRQDALQPGGFHPR